MTVPADEALPVSALEALDAATAAIAAEVSLEGVLQVIADRLRPLVGASYAALGKAQLHVHVSERTGSRKVARTVRYPDRVAPLAQTAEHFHGKEGVYGSSP